MSSSFVLSIPTPVAMIKKSMAFYSSKFIVHLPKKIRTPANIICTGGHARFLSPGRSFYTHDPSDPADFPGKAPSEFPNRGPPSYRPAPAVEVPELPNDPDLEPTAPPEIVADPPPTGPGQNPGPDFPVPPSIPPPKPDIPMTPPECTPSPPTGPPGEPAPEPRVVL